MFTGTLLWVIALTALLLWPLQNAQHEGAHAFMVKRNGGTITKMVLYPTGQDNRFSVAFWRQGFTWAYVSWKGGEYTREGRARISIAPQVTNTVVLGVLTTIRFLAAPGELLTSILAGMALTQYIDGSVGLGTFYKWWVVEDEDKTTDGWSFQRHTGLNPWLCRIGAATWHLGWGCVLFILW